MRRLGRVLIPAALVVAAALGIRGSAATQAAPASLTSLCAFCHPWMAEQWEQTAHARSSTNPAFLAALEGAEEPDTCQACHTPQPILATGLDQPVSARDWDADLGVDCRSCHQDGMAAQVGPLASEWAPFHATVEDPAFRTSDALCAPCHGAREPRYDQVSSFRASRYPGEGRSCQSCHLERERGPVSYGTRHVRIERSRHDMLGSDSTALLESAATVRVRLVGPRLEASLTNSGTGHMLPGSAGPEIRFHLQALDGAGKVLSEETVAIGWAGEGADRRLAPDARADLSLTLPTGSVRGRAEALYRGTPEGAETSVAREEVEL